MSKKLTKLLIAGTFLLSPIISDAQVDTDSPPPPPAAEEETTSTKKKKNPFSFFFRTSNTWIEFQQMNFNRNPATIHTFSNFLGFSGWVNYASANTKLDDGTYTHPYSNTQTLALPIPSGGGGGGFLGMFAPKPHQLLFDNTLTLDGALEHHSMRASYAYRKRKGKFNYSIGLTFKYQLNKLDFSQLTFADQIHPVKGFVSNTQEPIPNSTNNEWAAGVGLNIERTNKKWFLAAFIDNVEASPVGSFYGTPTERPEQDIYIQGGYYIKLKSKLSIIPNANYTLINNVENTQAGADAYYKGKYIAGANSNFDNHLRYNIGYVPSRKLRLMANYSVYKTDTYNYDTGTLGFLIGYKF